MAWRYLTARDPLELRGAGDAPAWFPADAEVEARVVAILGVEDAAFVVRLVSPSVCGLGDDVGLHLVLVGAGTGWVDSGVVDVRTFRFPPSSPALHEGQVGGSVEGRLRYERRPFDLAAVFAEAETARGSRLINGAELDQLVGYAARRSSAVTFVETYELRGVMQIPRIDLGIYGPDEEEAALPIRQRIEQAGRDVAEILALSRQEDGRFGFQVWVG
ncbi:MAG: hypothetical protein ACREEO_13655 [Phenylobacterium sp.]